MNASHLVPLLLAFCLLSHSAFSEDLHPTQSSDVQSYDVGDGRVFNYTKPDYLNIVTDLPKNGLLSLKEAFSKDKAGPWASIILSSVWLYKYDEDLLLHIQKQGRDLGIGNEERTKTVLSAGDIDLVRLPSDTGSTLYFIGDGWTHFSIAGGFLLYGTTKNDYRAWNTSYQLVHGMMLSTFFNQAIKRTTGRESPNEKSEPRGKWRPFPSIKAYNENTAKYDAVPSGHVMTSTLVMTIINENYPEYWYITLPAGGTLIGLLSWQMVNNGVHWASDYPLGFAMGLFYGKLVARNWASRSTSEELSLRKKGWRDFTLEPLMTYHQALGLSARWDF